jgi:hypothetical protein
MSTNDKKKKIRYVAKLDGIIVGQIDSHVPYTHALILQPDIEYGRREAYSGEDADAFSRERYDECEEIVKTGYARGYTRRTDQVDAVAVAEEIVAQGREGYRQYIRQQEISSFEFNVKNRYYDINVKWLRQEQVPKKPDQEGGYHKIWRIVSVGSVEKTSITKLFAKLPKAKQRELLIRTCEKMIARRAYDEIAAFLLGQLGGNENVAAVLELIE